MSQATPNQLPPPFPGQRTVSPWRATLIIGIVLIILIVLGFALSGSLPGFRKSQQTQEIPHTLLTPNYQAVVRPPEVPAEAAKAAGPQPQRQLLRPNLPGMPADQDKVGRNAAISAFALKPSAASAAAVKGGSEAGDPDKLPPSARADALEASLEPTKMTGTRVSELPNPRWLIEEGRILRCSQQTKINTSLPGGVTAIIPDEIRGETGDVVLLPKGAKVFGTIGHALINGLDRQAVLWQDITTPVLYDKVGMPHQFRVAANSPAASELGETGLDGDVNRHLFNPFPGKLGAILGMSLMRGAIDYAVQSANRQGNNNNTTNLNFNSFQQGGQGATDELLRSYIQIPDIMTRDPALPCSIFIMRDLDMRGAYRLQQNYRAQ